MLEGTTVLQWGRDQLIAEILGGNQNLEPALQLQWGRDQLIAEISNITTACAPCGSASMGPRSADRGNGASNLKGRDKGCGFNGAAIS